MREIFHDHSISIFLEWEANMQAFADDIDPRPSANSKLQDFHDSLITNLCTSGV